MAKTSLHASGFTIIELMITLAVAAILAAIAAPSFTTIIQDNRLVTQINRLQATLSLARSEAVKRNNSVTTCPSSNGTACIGNWENGLIVFLDIDADGSIDAGDEILRVHGPITAANTLRFGRARVTYAGNALATGFNGTFTLCDGRGATSARGLITNNSGRPRLAIDSNADGTVDTGTVTTPSTANVTCP